jgi:hypothetical protein
MVISLLIATSLVVNADLMIFPQVQSFPSSLYDSELGYQVSKAVLDVWPGPTALLQQWQTQELSQDARVTLLLGAAAFHDPQLLPMYVDGIGRAEQRVRQAAAYGYRDLLADRLPAVAGGIDDEQAALLSGEMVAVQATLRACPLVALWLNALLDNEGVHLPGYQGVVLKRAPPDCVHAVEALMGPEDLNLVVSAYRLSSKRRHRVSLMRLLEALSLRRLVARPSGSRGWGDSVYDEALERLEHWLEEWYDVRCETDFEVLLQGSLEELGVRGAGPMDPSSCPVWQAVLRRGDPAWWVVASRRLYECGGPAEHLEVFRADSPANRKRREQLLKWFGLN